jgi:hypothetical protein
MKVLINLMETLSRYLPLLASMLVLCLAPARASDVSENIAEVKMPLRPARLLKFPVQSVGGLAIYKYHKDHSQPLKLEGNVKASGMVKVPEGRYVVYFPNHFFFANPSCISNLAPDSLDFVVVRYASLQDSEEGRSDPAVASLARFTGLTGLDLEQSELTDKGIIPLRSLKDLQVLYLFGNMVEGDFFKDFAALKKLRILGLQGNTIAPRNMPYLAGLQSLEVLAISRAHLTAASAAPIGKLSSLQSLHLAGNTKLSDDFLPTLKALKKLNSLNVDGCGFTKEGFKKIEALPIAKIIPSIKHANARAEKEKAAATAKSESYGKKLQSNEYIFSPISRDKGL